MNLLLTGGAGYIGSHAVRRLLAAGHQLLIVDDFRHGHRQLLEAACSEHPERATVLPIGIADRSTLAAALRQHRIEAVMHFAAYIEVGESVADPLKYYRNNVRDALALLQMVVEAGVRKFIFSSTAAVYGAPAHVPIVETQARAPTNPYGRSKMMIEMALEDACAAYGIGYAILRYFNVAGASNDALLGEWHLPETHLIPRVLAAAATGAAPVAIFGTDYPTRDGTCLRDYVHVEDLVDAHVLALDALQPGHGEVFNVGSASGFTVREVISACEAVTGRRIEVAEQARRAGDPPALVADSERIRAMLGWTPRYAELHTIIAHAWQWQRKLEAMPAGAALQADGVPAQGRSDRRASRDVPDGIAATPR